MRGWRASGAWDAGHRRTPRTSPLLRSFSSPLQPSSPSLLPSLPTTFPTLTTPTSVDSLITQLYSPSLLSSLSTPSTLHITSVHSPPLPPSSSSSPHPLPTLRIGPTTPTSPYDLFALSLSRARSSLIVLTAAILRAEPHLTGNPLPPHLPALQRWQLSRGRTPARVVILTRGGVDFVHPLFAQTVGDVAVYTSAAFYDALITRLTLSHAPHTEAVEEVGSAAHRMLRASLGALQVRPQASSERVVTVVSPVGGAASLTSLLAFFRPTHHTISIECGPSTTALHYAVEGSRRVDDLFLSLYHGALPAPSHDHLVHPARGPVLTRQWVERHFQLVTASRAGEWTFEWHRSRHIAS